ncbi:torsin-1A-interacting protein 2-like isoform X2 [Antennarius striatus]|uniref:torsin-1A-interacting protein 2-like isoform X2 n=1 Tax=Antennarius striatus TaxID=241820 RepID=UPI0035B0C9C2
MDSETSENAVIRPLRRSTRHSSVLHFEATPRGPLKRTKKTFVDRVSVAAANGSRDADNGPEKEEDEESPTKKSRLEAGGHSISDDDNKMDVQESSEELAKKEVQETDVIQDSSHKQTPCHGPFGDMNLLPCVVLGERCKSFHAVNENKKVKSSTTELASSKSLIQNRPVVTRHDAVIPKISTMDEYRKTMEAKIKSTAKPTVNHHAPSMCPPLEKSYITRQRVNNIPAQKKPAKELQDKKQVIKKTAVIKKSSAQSSRGSVWCFWGFFFLLLCSFIFLVAYKIIPVQIIAHDGEWTSKPVKIEKFADQLTILKSQFPGQRPELWKRSKIHLEKHLKTKAPTEPVSLIFTAGLRAEKTLRCLAQRMAASFSLARNASVLLIDGASKANQDSGEVKLEIDTQLQAAFDGDKPVAVIHRFEELPPSSTLIFYRYCDHENAAYKNVFLLFTVLLPQDEVTVEQSLKEVEEMVHDYVKERLVDSDDLTGFNKMDIDKYGGLWSRISHLILPVVSEVGIEQKEC